jgi:UrcA family protein
MIMNIYIQTNFRAAALLLCGAMSVGGLQATARAAEDGLPKETVRFADLDISKPEGAKVLYQRIVAAAGRVCTSDGFQTLRTMKQDKICTDTAVDKAVKAVGSPALSALRWAHMIHLASN